MTGDPHGRIGGGPAGPATQTGRTFGIRGLHHVQLACPPGGEDAARAFYRGLLGFVEVTKPPGLAGRGGVWFRNGPAGPVEVHIGVEPDFRPAGKAHPGFVVSGLDALADRLAQAGYPVDWDGEFPGFRRCYTRDPSGNRVELLEPVEPDVRQP